MKKILSFIAILAGFTLAIVAIHVLFLAKADVKFDQVGLGEGTIAYFPTKNNLPIHIDEVGSIPAMIQNSTENAGTKEIVLWLGNSQLFGVNQYKAGQHNSVEYLHDSLSSANKFVIGYSLPNANLQEHFVIFKYLINQVQIKQLLIPVFFDDTRESGLRDELLAATIKNVVLKDMDSSSFSKSLIATFHAVNDSAKDTNGDMNALAETTQESVETFFNKQLASVSEIWDKRSDIRSAMIYHYIFKIRNSALGITPSSKRKKIVSRYDANMEAFSKICELAKSKGIDVLLYIPPIRNDVEQPYIKDEYDAFKAELMTYQKKYGLTLYNAENVVPAQFWGMKNSTTLDMKKLEVDFMHFQAEGHRLLADSLASVILKK